MGWWQEGREGVMGVQEGREGVIGSGRRVGKE